MSFLAFVVARIAAGFQIGNTQLQFQQMQRIDGTERGRHPGKAGKQEAVEVFNSHVAEVKAYVPADRLLVFDVREGWAPLCKFLDRSVPDIPFPNVNDTATMRRSSNIIRIVCWFVVLVVPMALAFFVPRCETLAGSILVTALLLAIVPASGQLLRARSQQHWAASQQKK